jgi:hypothetical protein
MSIQKISIALASVLVMAAGVPAFANTVNTSGTSQVGTQVNEISGNRSSGTNVSSQNARTGQSGRNTDNQAATVQDNYQRNTVSGDRSTGRNTNDQNAVTIQRR